MANIQYTTIKKNDFGSGTDQLSPETNVAEGHVESLSNVDPRAEGHLTKRTGYQGYAGFMPVRVTRVDYTTADTDNLCFTLDRAVDFTLTRSSPLVAYGRTSATHTGDFTATDSVHYYPGFHPRIKKTFPASATTTLPIPASEHGQETGSLLVGLAESTSFINTSNSLFFPDSVTVDSVSFAVGITAENNSPSAVSAYVYYLKQDPIPGSIYVETRAISSGTNTYPISQSIHQLGSSRILATIYSVNGNTRTLVEPDAFRILPNGNVEFDITTNTGFTAYIILSTCPLDNYATTSIVPSLASQSVIFPVTSSFIFPAIYRDTGTQLEQVLPDSLTVDDAADTCTITFTNDGVGANFQIYWQYGNVSSNTICVDAVAGTTYTDVAPQITLWGLDHLSLYSSGERGGWVNHIDSYRAAGDAFVVAGLGGNLFRSGSRADYGTSHLLPLLYPALRARSASLQYVGPVFWETGDTPLRTRGYITADGGAAHQVTCTGIAYNAGNVDYTLSLPSMVISGSLSSIISTTAGLEDWLTVSGASYARHNGTFRILAVSQASPTSLVISVENPAVDSSDWDDTGCAALASILTDQLTLSATSPFLPGDILSSEVFSNGEVVQVLSSEGAVSVISGLDADYGFTANQRVVGSRTSSVMPVRQLDETPSVTNLVKGDMLALTGYSREIRILSINPNSTLTCTIVGDGQTAQLTLGSGNTDAFTVGQKVLVSQAGDYSGEQTITSVDSLSQFSFDHSSTASEAGFLVGKTIEMDESLAWGDAVTSSNSLSVPRRWIPIEAPDDSFDLTPSTNVYHWHSGSYDNRPLMRSVMSADDLYISSGADPIMKFDGQSIYRAGLPRWQPTLWATVDTSATGKISIKTPTVTPHSAPVAGDFKFTIHLDDVGNFKVGGTFTHTADGSHYTIASITENTTATPSPLAYLHVTSPIPTPAPGTGTLTSELVAKYYMRLNSVDANNNVIASAVVGADDNVVRLSQDAAVTLRAVGLPAWDNYDHERLELEIYRTPYVPEWNTTSLASFYRLASIPLSFSKGAGYILFTDTTSNDTLDTIDPTSLLTAGELGTQFSEPLIAKSITSAGNKLILGNVTDYPELSIVMQSAGAPILASTLVGKRWLLRRDNTDTATDSNMADRVGLEWVGTSGSKVVSGITSTASDFTVTTGSAHGQVAGNWVYLYASAVSATRNSRYSGWFQVASAPTATTFTVNDTGNLGTSGVNDVDRMVGATLAGDVPVLIGTDGNYGTVNGNTASASDSYMFLGMRRLSAAINAAMRKTDVSMVPTFVPWIMAYAGNEYDAGQLVLRVPRLDSTSVEVELPTYSATDWRIYGNAVLRTSGSSVGALSKTFPSRLLVSYANYPELFDAPTVDQDKDSVSAIDINTADGQEITAVIPFFGSSAFGAAMQSGVVVVFKTNSIYLVDLSEKAKGNNAVQKIESAGLGCTAPGSVVATKDGIMFANESGVYRLKRDLTVEYVGRRMERTWRGEVNTNQLALMAGHMHQATSRYKLSVPYTGEDSPTGALVYDYTREYRARISSNQAFMGAQGMGSWTQYTNHPAIGWCNLLSASFMATTKGQVFTPRITGELSDYRDDAAPILGTVVFGATDFGDSSIRKLLSAVIVHYRARTGVTETMQTSLAADLEDDFASLDESSVKADTGVSSGMGDTAGRKVRSIRYSVSRRRLLYAQLQIQNGEKDTPMEIAEVAWRVAGLSEFGITQGPATR